MGQVISIKAVSKNSRRNSRRRPKLLPEKLLVIREHLNASQTAMQAMLKLPNRGRISEYENGVREPNLMVMLAYSRLAKVPMASLVDDDVSVNEFREELGKFDIEISTDDSQAKQQTIQRNKPFTLINGRR